jgi:hypothetical protein
MTEQTTMREMIRGRIGDDALPTGELRMRHTTRTTARLEHLWRGGLGEMWVEVPNVDANGQPLLRHEAVAEIEGLQAALTAAQKS